MQKHTVFLWLYGQKGRWTNSREERSLSERQFVVLGLEGRREMKTYNAGQEACEQWTANLYVILALLLVGDEPSWTQGGNGDQLWKMGQHTQPTILQVKKRRQFSILGDE